MWLYILLYKCIHVSPYILYIYTIYMHVCSSVCISICSSTHQYTNSSIHQVINLNRLIDQSIHPFIHLSIRLFICISLYLLRKNMMNILMTDIFNNFQQGIQKHSKANGSLPSGHSSFHCISCSKSPGSFICKPEMLVKV